MKILAIAAALCAAALASPLPDLLQLPGGKRVTTPAGWRGVRSHWKQLLLSVEYGQLPAPVAVKGRVLSRQPVAQHTEEELDLHFGALPCRAVLSLPSARGPFPLIVDGDLGWHRLDPALLQLATGRGYAVLEFNREDVAADRAEPTGIYAQNPNFTGGRLAAWAWGFSRALDYAVTRPEVDQSRLVVTGHSRGGKAALLAGALDTRVWLTAPNGSGCGGAGSYHVQGPGSETLDDILRQFPYWFTPQLQSYRNRQAQLPFDQHALKALVAPRALIATEADGDIWANPQGTKASQKAAAPVFRLLGVPDHLAWHTRPGKHQHNLEDWTAMLDFAARLKPGH